MSNEIQQSVQSASFLPQDYLKRKVDRRNSVISLTLFSVVMLAVVGAFFVTNREWSSVKDLQKRINAEYAAEAKKIEQLKVLESQKTEMLDKAEITAALIERVPRSILFAEIINRLPPDVTLTEFNLIGTRQKASAPLNAISARPGPRSLARGGAPAGAPEAKPTLPKPPKFDFKLEIIGLAADDSNVADFHRSLKSCPLLSNVDLLFSGEKIIEDKSRRLFRMELAIHEQADARKITPMLALRADEAFGEVKSSGGMSKLMNMFGGGDKSVSADEDGKE